MKSLQGAQRKWGNFIKLIFVETCVLIQWYKINGAEVATSTFDKVDINKNTKYK